MTNEELCRVQSFFGLNNVSMAGLLGTPERTYYRWISGTSRVPGTVDAYVVTLLRYPHVRNEVIRDINERR